MVTLYDVIDIRTDKHHSVAVVPKRLVKYFIPANSTESDE